MKVKIGFSLRSYCIGFWWGEGRQVDSGADHVVTVVLPMVGIMFLWSSKKR